MIVITGRGIVKKEKLNEALDAAAEMARLSQEEEGCITYELLSNPKNPVEFVLFAEWDSQESADNHFESEHFAQFSAMLPDLLEDAMVMRQYKVKSVSTL